MSTRRARRRLLGDWRELGRFVASGLAGSLLLFALYELVYRAAWVERNNAPFSWAVSYFLASLCTHGLHRRHTFRWATPYWRTLGRTALVYAVSLTATTAVDYLLVGAGLNHRMAWVLTLLTGGTGNYLALRNWGFLPRGSRRSPGR